MQHRRRSNRRRQRAVATALLTAVLVGTAAPLATADEAAPASRSGERDAVQRQLDLLVEQDGVPGALLYDGTRTRTAGTAELGTDREMVGPDASFRMASDTKTFTATAVMRLIADRKLGLNDPAGRYVPQLADSPVTVRQLLKQTSGLPEYTVLLDWTQPGTPAEYLRLALAEEPVFEPGTDWGYSNTNYLVLGMIIDEVSGTDFRTYITRTVLEPLGLESTYWPERGETALRGSHARNYGISPADPEAGMVDLTELPGYEFGASGGLVTTAEDLNAFWDGLFGGRLLPTWALLLMTVDTTDVGGEVTYPKGSRYGYGVASFPLSCGGFYWGHGGDLPGNSVAGGRDFVGRGTVTAYTTTLAAQDPALGHLQSSVDAALCAK